MAQQDDEENVAALDGRTARLLANAAAPAPLPAALRARLLALPAIAEREDEEARRYERARAAGLAAAAAGHAQVDASLPPAERAIAGWIAVARRSAPLPAALLPRLLAAGRGARRPLPFWLVDGRFAAAACLILTLVSMVAVEDASALLAGRAAEARLGRHEWPSRFGGSLSGGLPERLAGRLAGKVGAGRDQTVAAVTGTYRRGEQAFLSRAEEVRDLFEEKLRQFRQTELGRRLADEPSKRGNDDGKP